MSVVGFPDAVDSSADLHIWNNAAFDGSKDLTASRQSWGSLKSIFSNPKGSFDSISDKENQCFTMENSQMVSSVSSSMKSSTTPFKPVNTDDRATEKSRITKKEVRDGKKIDEEIEEIESEIFRLKSRLEALRIEKAERSVKAVEKRGRVVSAKFMDQKQSVCKNAGDKKINEEIPSMSGKSKIQRRGISLGPVEILSAQRRGMSMGPAEIFAKSRQLGKQEMVTPLQSRRKSCFYKLQEIDEESVVEREKGKKISSLSPKSRKVAAKTQALPRQAVTTISSKKNLKKEDSVINSLQPKKLFREGEKMATNKKPLRPGRVVASRYNQNTSHASSAMRKRSLLENETDNRFDKKRSLSVGKSGVNVNEEKSLGTESRVKKRWEIPSEIDVHGSGGDVERERTTHSVVAGNDLLPKIRVSRCVNESPRDSGPAKKVVELIGRKSFFSHDGDEVVPSVCQVLTYAEEDEGEEY